MTKRYGPIVACDGVDLTLRHGEIHGILGENGAGKSTLMRMLIGLALPDRGSIFIEGEKVRVNDPLQAARLGIGMVHQHYSLVDALTVWENVALGERDRLAPEATRIRISEISERYGLEVDPEARVGDLTAGMRQRVEIVKCLRHGPRIIILDEPTSVLSPPETAKLFDVLREGVQRDGWAVVLVSHKLHEVLRVTDRITIMRDGRVVDEVPTGDADAPSLARAMVGRPVALRAASAAIGAAVAPTAGSQQPTTDLAPVLEIREATAHRSDGRVLLDRLSLTVRPGEIVGVAGVEGNGQHALGDLLSSLLPLQSGSVLVAEEPIPTGRAGAMAAAGVAVIPEDRHESGVVVEMSVAENLSLATMPTRRGVIDRRELAERADRLIAEFDIHTPGPDTPVGQLSGGNQQRVLLARALSTGPRVLVAAQPTRGLDVGAIEYVGERLEQAARDGIAVLLISTDLGEIAALAQRIVVIYRGSIVGEMDRSDLDMERLGLLIGGVVPEVR
ncbi:MAG: ABC transporter ATP-binding protein [Acidimicrobiia bacterium]|nr:MAG: ABC transporter ATP-binding protein [Acidimicrobiia bacterium]